MSNSPLVSHTRISPNKGTRYGSPIDTVSIHCVVGQATVESLGTLFSSGARGASSNYGVGVDGRIGMYVEEKDRSWCTSSVANDARAITIEVASDKTHPYAVNAAAMEGLIRLLVDICRRNPAIGRLRWRGDKNLIGQTDKQNMTVHRWFANKACPGEYLYERHGEIAAEVNRRLDEMEDNDMTVERFTELYNEMRAQRQDNDAGGWSAEAREWAVENGIFVGNGEEMGGEPNYMWEDVPTREQLAVILFKNEQRVEKMIEDAMLKLVMSSR